MKKILTIVILAAMLLWATPYLNEYFSTKSVDGTPVTITIPEGASTDAIGDILKENNLISNKNLFKLKVKLSQYNNRLNYGTYTLDDGMCLSDIISTLASTAGQETVSLVVPEGYSVQQIGKKAELLGICTKEEFLSALNEDYDYEFIKYIPRGNYDYKLQGFLFPDTYTFFLNSTPRQVVDEMLKNFDYQYKKHIGAYSEETFKTVTKASLVEKEAVLERERPIIAGVIENRLRINMALQIDAAIVYFITDGSFDAEKVYYKDLEKDSPYNVYKTPGLPAGPICNPGISSLMSAAKPKSHNYLYYHTDTEKNNGSHIFTETYNEHLNTMNQEKKYGTE